MNALSAVFMTLWIVTGSPQADGLTSWGTYYIIDPVRVEQTMSQEKVCLERILAKEPDTVELDKRRVGDCDFNAYIHSMTDDKQVFYFYSGQQEAGDSPFADFDICSSSLASPMWDFPDTTTVEDYRTSIRDCLSLFPSTF